MNRNVSCQFQTQLIKSSLLLFSHTFQFNAKKSKGELQDWEILESLERRNLGS
jgi:hypothetical protein